MLKEEMSILGDRGSNANKDIQSNKPSKKKNSSLSK